MEEGYITGGLQRKREASVFTQPSVWLSSGNSFESGGAISATPAVYKGVPYFPTWSCSISQQNHSKPEVPDPCVEPENHGNSILALELASGHIRWSTSVRGLGAWNEACNLPGRNPNCPPGPALDYDFAEAPMLLTIPMKSSLVDVAELSTSRL